MTVEEKIAEVEKWADPYYEVEIENDWTTYLICYPAPGVMEEWKFNADGSPAEAWRTVANCPNGVEQIKIF